MCADERKPCDLKVYVEVMVRFQQDGTILPMQVAWEDGLKYEIGKVVDIRPATVMKAGGQGYVK